MTEELVNDMLPGKQVMDMLGISESTLRRWRRDGRIPYREFPRNHFRYTKEGVDKILREGIS